MISNPIEVKALDNFIIQIRFEDGVSGQIDLSSLKGKGVFKVWSDYEKFKSVYIDVETKSIAWDKMIELDANNLYLQLIGMSFEQWKDKKLQHASDK